MSVYKNDNPQDFKTAVHSIYDKQTVRPTEIVLIEDGPISVELKTVIAELCEVIPVMKVVSFAQNRGHAAARQAGLENATNELVAIMDADDIAAPNRFEWQLQAFKSHPEVTVIGGNIAEFIEEKNHVVSHRLVPETDAEIKDYLKSRCPLNLVTVMYKKSEVQKVGGFKDWFCEEDYYLWIRLTLGGFKFYNIQKNLVHVRVGEAMYQRRGGWKYFKSEALLQKYMYDYHLISGLKLVYNVSIRFVVQVMMPNHVRGWVFKKFARK